MEAMARDLAVGAIAPALQCCVTELGSTAVRSIDYDRKEEGDDRRGAPPPPRRIRLASRMTQGFRKSSRELMSNLKGSATSSAPPAAASKSFSGPIRGGDGGGKGRSSPVSAFDAAQLVAQEYFAGGGGEGMDVDDLEARPAVACSREMDELLNMPSLPDGSEMEPVATEEKRVDPPSGPPSDDMDTSEEQNLDHEIDMLFGPNHSQEMDELFAMPTDREIVAEANRSQEMDELFAANIVPMPVTPNVAPTKEVKSAVGGSRASFTMTATTCSVHSDMSARSSEEVALAREVGLSAHEYLEECFYTEVSVLNREKFDAVPEIAKGDFSVLGHLGKGSFSDVFEVVCKGGRLPGSKSPGAGPRRLPSHARGRRSTFASSINVASLSRQHRAIDAARRPYALKCLRPQIRSDVDQFTIGAEDLVHETAILANLDHPNIIKLHGRASGSLTNAFVLNDGYFILLDKLDETLVDRMKAWKDRDRDHALRLRGPGRAQLEVARSAAEALRYLHSKRIVLRDLKPANVGFDSQGALKLFDFGFAIGLPEPSAENPLGLLHDRCGTPRYMSPEVGLSLGYASPADVYSFGILLWETCSLSKPFAHIRSTGAFDREVFVGGSRPPVGPGWPPQVRALMESCWEAMPARRPTMEEVLARLPSVPSGPSACEEGTASPSPSPSPIKARRVGARDGRFRRSTMDFGRF